MDQDKEKQAAIEAIRKAIDPHLEKWGGFCVIGFSPSTPDSAVIGAASVRKFSKGKALFVAMNALGMDPTHAMIAIMEFSKRSTSFIVDMPNIKK